MSASRGCCWRPWHLRPRPESVQTLFGDVVYAGGGRYWSCATYFPAGSPTWRRRISFCSLWGWSRSWARVSRFAYPVKVVVLLPRCPRVSSCARRRSEPADDVELASPSATTVTYLWPQRREVSSTSNTRHVRPRLRTASRSAAAPKSAQSPAPRSGDPAPFAADTPGPDGDPPHTHRTPFPSYHKSRRPKKQVCLV